MLTCQSTVVDCCWLPKLNCDVSVNNSKWSSYWNHWKAWFHIPLQMTWLTDWKVCDAAFTWMICVCVFVCMCFLIVRVKSVLSAIATQLPCAAYSAFHTYRYYFAILALTFIIYLKHTMIFDVHIKYVTLMCSYHTSTLSTSTRTHK